MGCAISSNASGDDNRANIVRKPTPWGFDNGPISKTQLQEMRNEFWHKVVRTGRRPDVWEALRAATEGDLCNAQKIIEQNNIRLWNQDMSICYDDEGDVMRESDFSSVSDVSVKADMT
ncbi:ubiquitin domain-containing protein 1 [Artemisia annua]|uniref:Ubiquitin domain-containing protein 1 n=1 Tax=Artemisia annua TaxID=35608 RepID=A0A2U1QJQ7_ARTAN|nr:ubiquitin domain-containing protein 1 [Artemisia annua]